MNSNWSYSPEMLNWGRHWYFVPCDLQIWWMTLENNRAPLLYYIKLRALFQIHRWCQTWVTIRKRSIQVKIGVFCPTWPWNFTNYLKKQKGTSSILRWALCIISKPWVNSNLSYNLETLNSGQNWQFFVPNLGQNQPFFSPVTLKFDRWPLKTIEQLF